MTKTDIINGNILIEGGFVIFPMKKNMLMSGGDIPKSTTRDGDSFSIRYDVGGFQVLCFHYYFGVCIILYYVLFLHEF